MDHYIFINGEIVPSTEAKIHVSDIGLLRGYGLFDFFRAVDGKPIFLEDYLDRFERSMKGLQLSVPYTRDYLRNKIYELVSLHPQYDLLGIKMVCTGGYSPDGYAPTDTNFFMLAAPFKFHPYEKGLKLMTVPFQRELFQIKSINYLTPISLLPKMRAIQADDVLYHFNGLVSESSRSNIFIIKDGIMSTPSDGILEGITRKRILAFAEKILPVQVRNISLEEVLDADEVFLTASTKRISPVTAIDDTRFVSGPFTKVLYDRLLEEEKMD